MDVFVLCALLRTLRLFFYCKVRKKTPLFTPFRVEKAARKIALVFDTSRRIEFEVKRFRLTRVDGQSRGVRMQILRVNQCPSCCWSGTFFHRFWCRIGDGSVRPLSTSLRQDTLPENMMTLDMSTNNRSVFTLMVHVSDGQSVAIP